ncbi:TolC family protein [Sphingobacterium rhinopitheci]|uniref:TolC family protein n=1 Tax=Sphingobacterium rhinopitheci TaxID=2781960 RepID=UPI001F5285CD|nr:TolC family protein [Sphingobacterium rhinopitheci]MCI0922097.1 TolC family protein [Sphingobacterium rhinopitheci]
MKYFLFIILFSLLKLDVFVQKRWSLEEYYAVQHNIPLKRQDILIAIKNLDHDMALRERLPSVGGYLNGYSTFGHSQDVFGTIQRNDNFNSNLGINSEIVLYQYNYFRNQAKKATIQADQERIEKDILIRDLTLKVLQGYLEVLLAQSLVNSQDSAIYFSIQLLDKTEKSAKVGATAPAVVSEVKATLAREKQQYQQYHKELQLKKMALAQQMNYPDYNQLNIYDPQLGKDVFNKKIEIHKDYEVQSALAKNPIFLKYKSQLLELDIEDKIIKSGNYPLIKGSASLGTTYFNAFKANNTSPLFTQTKDNFAQQVAVAVTIPIFNKGKSKRLLQQNSLRKNEIDLLTQYEENQQIQMLQKVVIDYQENIKQYEISKEAFLATKESLEYSNLSFIAGKVSIYDVNNIKNNLIKTEAEMIRAKYNTLFSLLTHKYFITGYIN